MIRTMIRAVTLALAGLAVMAGAAAAEPERPTLRTEALVTGSVVRIGDLIDNAGIVANVPVFRAPALGQTGTVSAAQVLEAVRAHALVGIDPGSVSEVTVIRASRVIPAHDIEILLAATLAKTYSLGNAADVSITFDRVLRAVQVEPSVTAAPRIEQLRYDPRSGRFEAVLDVPDAPYARARLFGTAVATGEIVELSRPLTRGEIVKMGDLTLKRIPRNQITADTITDPDQALGLAARTTIDADRPVRRGDLTKPELVQRNESVTIVYQAPGIMLAVRGKAVDGGTAGDMIDVVNVQSNRTVRGTIVGPGQVAVASMAARVITTAQATFDQSQARFGAK
jgi:flagella basal body P-ring formation protein FlgA